MGALWFFRAGRAGADVAGAGGARRGRFCCQERQSLAMAALSLVALRGDGGGLGVRCYSLCVSFHYVGGSRTIFGPYFLVPIGLAVSLIWLEIGIARRRRGVMVVASLMPLALAFMATMGFRYEPVYMHFLDLFSETLGGSPVFLTLVGAAAFHGYAAVRRVPLAWELLARDLVALAAVGPMTFDLHETIAMHPLPLAAAGLVLGTIAWRGWHSGRAAAAAGLLVTAITRGCAEIWPDADSTLIAIQLFIVALMVFGALFDDWLRQLAQNMRVGRFAGDRCRCRGSCPGDRPSLAGQARPLVASVRHRCDPGRRAHGPRSSLFGSCRCQPGCLDRSFRPAELPATSPHSDRP